MVTGRVERGIVKVGEEIEIVGIKETPEDHLSPAWKCSASCWTTVEAGDNVGALLRGIKREDVERGQVLCKPGSINPHTKFTAQVYVLTKDEGGRHTPFFNNYRPQFYFRTTDVTGIDRAAGRQGNGACLAITWRWTVELITPIAMEEGLRFAIREGGRTVGSGVVTAINEVSSQAFYTPARGSWTSVHSPFCIFPCATCIRKKKLIFGHIFCGILSFFPCNFPADTV